MIFSILFVCRFAIRNANFEAEIISEDVAFSPTTIIDFTLSSSKKKSSLGTEEEPTLIGSIKENKIIEKLKKKDIEIEITDIARKVLAEKGYDPQFGARPLKRVIQREILDPISEKLIVGKIKKGKKIVVSSKNNEIEIKI